MMLVTVEEMREIEQLAIEQSVSSDQMMQRAGKGLAEIIIKHFKDLITKHVIGLVGKGNNGGDAIIALNQLLLSGWYGAAILFSPRQADPLVEEFINNGGRIINYKEADFKLKLKEIMLDDSVIVDGLLGTGIKMPLKAEMAEFISLIKKAAKGKRVVAVDCPSGVDCDSGDAAAETIPAELTVCMQAVKVGLMKQPAFSLCGEIETVSLGLPKEITKKYEGQSVVDDHWAAAHLPVRSAFSHKGSFGKVMVVGGSVNYVGAPFLSGLAAYRLGSGLVTLAVPQQVASTMAGNAPEITWVILDDEDGVIAETAAEVFLKKVIDYDCLAVGPGIGTEEATQRFLHRVLFQPSINDRRKVGFLAGETSTNAAVKIPTVVIDADALRWLAKQQNWFESISSPMVLTPHPGEMAALTGLKTEEIQKDRIACASSFAQKWHQVVVLKGALTVIAAPDGRINIIPIATSALAKAGSGDVLTGMITSLIGQGVQPFEAATLGAWMHAKAGLRAAEKMGCEASVLARDIISALPEMVASVKTL